MIRQTLGGRLLHNVKNRGVLAWAISLGLMGFYVLLYFTEALTPLAKNLGLGGKWDLYGCLYTVAILTGGAYVVRKYRHNRYQIVRTASVMFFQVSFAFSIPMLLRFFDQPEYYFSYIWPLKIEYLYPDTIRHHPLPFVIYSFAAAMLLVPIMALRYGKRWYCSWVCGCGGLANTFGEPWRHLSSKSTRSWRFERVSIHAVLALALTTTAFAIASAFVPGLEGVGHAFRKYYGLVVGSILAGVVGTGLYPIGGTRVWCRNFCPMAALLGVIQKAGRFRIRVKKDMCISCGLCSKYCEMGIDVRSYAQANESFTRASCVGCGLCAEVCPRGVLRLENAQRPDPREAAMTPIVFERRGAA